MRLFITGARGFLGSWVVRAMLNAGHELRALLRPPRDPSGVSERSPALSRRAGVMSPIDRVEGVEPVWGDLEDVDVIVDALRGVDAIVHIAGHVSMRRRDRAQLQRVNVRGTELLLTQAQRLGLRMLHTSTIGTLPCERAPVLHDERSFVTPEQAACLDYLDTKLRAERAALAAAQGGADIVVLNPGVLLGPGDRYLNSTRPVLHHLRGQQRLCPAGGISFADVRDVAQAYVSALERGVSGRRYLLAGINMTYAQLFLSLHALTGIARASPMSELAGQYWAFWSEWAAVAFGPHPFEEYNFTTVSYGSRYNYCDCSRAALELGYSTRDFHATLRDTVIDLLARGVARASTPRLASLLASSTVAAHSA